MRYVFLFAVLLVAVAQASTPVFLSCRTTASSYSSNSEVPDVMVILTANGTIDVTQSPGANYPIFSLLHPYNLSNDARLDIDYDAGYSIDDDDELSFTLFQTRGEIDQVVIKYVRQEHQPFDLTIGGEVVEDFELTCDNELLTTLYRSMAVDPSDGSERQIHIFFTGDVTRCDGSTTEVLDNSWLVYDSQDGGATVLNGGVCNTTLADGFVPYEGSKSHWYCVANSSFTDVVTQASYTIAEDYICDALDNSSVTTHGYGQSNYMIVYGVEQTTYQDPEATIYPDGTVNVFTVLPVKSLANFSAIRPCVWAFSMRSLLAQECCSPVSAAWKRADAIQYTCDPEFPYTMGEDVDFKLLGDSLYTFDLPNGLVSTYAVKSPGFDDEGTTNYWTVHDSRIKGIYRADSHTIRVEFYQMVQTGLAYSDLIVFDATTQYNATNISRYDAHTAVFGFNEDNELPALGSDFKAYLIQFGDNDGSTEDQPFPVTTPVVITAVPASASTSSKGADLDDLSDEWKAFVWTGWAVVMVLVFIGLVFLIYHGCKGNGYLSTTGYPHNL